MSNQDKNYRLKGHGGFIMREGWYTKALREIQKNPKIFSKENYLGADALGVGSAMAKAVKYWMNTAGMTQEKRGLGTFLTSAGQLIYEEDRYFEDIFTVWFLHWNIVRQEKEATIWYLFFHDISMGEFTKEQMEERLHQKLEGYAGDDKISNRSFGDDCNTLLQMYVQNAKRQDDPEDKQKSIFAKLGLVRRIYNDHYDRPYVKDHELPENIVEMAVSEYLLQHKSVKIQDLLNGANGLGKVFSLNRVSLETFLEKMEVAGRIQVDRAASLDTIYTTKLTRTPDEIMKKHYEDRKRSL